MPNRDFLWFVDRSLWLLGQDVPEAYRGMAAAADGLRIAIDTGTEQGTVWVSGTGAEVFGPSGEADVFVKFDERVIVDLIDANLSLDHALKADRLVLAGSHRDLDRLISGLRAYLRGAIRSTAMQLLLDEFRSRVMP